MPISTVGIVGHGAFGQFLALLIAKFAPAVSVRIHSSRHEPDGKTFFSLADVAASDAVVLAVPIAAYEETIRNVLPLLRSETILVDVATVKVYTAGLLKTLAADRRYISTHPMFGPESYAKRQGNVAGFRIVVAEHTLAEESYMHLAAFLRACGFDIVEMTPEEHDKHLAETLFLTHFLGQAVTHAGFTRTEIDTVSFGYLMDAVESVRHDTALFKDVYAYNPYCKDILKRLHVAESEVEALLESK
jgi:prephenate dehydrogenase